MIQEEGPRRTPVPVLKTQTAHPLEQIRGEPELASYRSVSQLQAKPKADLPGAQERRTGNGKKS